MNTPARRFILLVICVLVAAAAFMAPRRDEWFAMMRDEDKQAQIIAMLEPRLARDGDDPYVLATLARSYAESGRPVRAAELLERYLVHRPDDYAAYARLADLYKNTGDAAKRITMLRRSLAIKPNLQRSLELAELYRTEHREEDEIAVLSRHEGELPVEGGILLRLAQLHAEKGNLTAAIHILMRPAVISQPSRSSEGHEARIYLAKLLVRSGRSAELVPLGKRWIEQWHEPWLADRLLQVVALEAPEADAKELGAAVADQHPEVRFYITHKLANTGATAVARHLLMTWIDKNPSPTMEELAAFLSACRELDQPGIVWRAFSTALRNRASRDVITRYSEAIAAEFGIGALAPFWRQLPPATLESKPLLAARLAFHEGDVASTRQLLDRVELATLSVSERRMWADLLLAVATPTEAFDILRDRWNSGRLSRDLVADYLRLASGLGHELDYRRAASALQRGG